MKRCLFLSSDVSSVVHVTRRCVSGQYLLDAHSKEVFVAMLRKTELFSGIEVLNYCVMDNHYHLLLRIPAGNEEDRHPIEVLIKRYRILYGDGPGRGGYPDVARLKTILEREDEESAYWRKRLSLRMEDLSAFMKTLNQRFSIWYNDHHLRYGTMWAGPFQAGVVEDDHSALAAVSAYIDLNPVRAGMVNDPKEYRWSGFGSAMAGNTASGKGLAQVMGMDDWNNARAQYRVFLYSKGAGNSKGRAVNPDAVSKVIARGGKVSAGELLHCKLAYFKGGVSIGSAAFLEQVKKHAISTYGRKGSRKTIHSIPINEVAVYSLVLRTR